YIYVSLLRQIAGRAPEGTLGTDRRFGLPEAALAIVLSSLFVLTSVAASASRTVHLRTRDLVGTALMEFGLVALIALFLRLRHFRLVELTGMGRLSFRRAFVTGLFLLIVAYPLIIMADWVTARV